MQCGFAKVLAFQTVFGDVQLCAEGRCRRLCVCDSLVKQHHGRARALSLCSRPQQLSVERASPAPVPVKFSPHRDEKAPNASLRKTVLIVAPKDEAAVAPDRRPGGSRRPLC